MCRLDRDRRHGVRRPRGRILHVRRRAVRHDLQCVLLQDRRHRAADQHRPRDAGRQPRPPSARRGGHFPVAPVDSAVDIRGEMVSTMIEMGLPCDKHHHEVAAAQHELGSTFGTLTQTADRMQIYKYVVHQVAHAYGKSATFMPKPIKEDNGSGMHTHFSIWRQDAAVRRQRLCRAVRHLPLFHRRHHQAREGDQRLHQPDHQQLQAGPVPETEAPVLLAYSARNRSASCRIPYGTGPKSKRVEVRFPDAMANPYLAYAALLMAGLDGIQNKIHPGEAMDKNLYDLPPAELAEAPTVCASLRAKRSTRSRRTTTSC
ncbi:hypothetical protein AB5I41_02150 [Sphingomonas sp. MMS24-JH45]